ncbi:MAG: hypothetical protein U0525_05915 [Patescibacteria group bacterium]
MSFAPIPIGEWARSRDAQNIQTVVANVGPHDLYGGRSAGGAWMQVMDYVCGNDKIANVMLAGLFERGQYSINDEEMRRLENAGYKETDRVVVRYCPAIEHSGSPVCHVFSRG